MQQVTLVTTFPSNDAIGGVATYSSDLANALQDQGVQLDVLAQVSPTPEEPGRPIWEFGHGFRRSIIRTLKSSGADVVHVQHEPFLYGSGLAAANALLALREIGKMGTALVVTLHGVPFPGIFSREARAPAAVRFLGRTYLKALRFIAGDVARFIVHEEKQKESLVRLAGIPARKTDVVPHGIGAVQTLPAIPPRNLTIGTFGYLAPYKDPMFAIDEFVRLREVMPEAQLKFSLSRHPRRQTRKSESEYASIRSRALSEQGVSFSDHIPPDELPAFIRDCDLIVAPYRYPVSASGVVCTSIGLRTPVLLPRGFGYIPDEIGWQFQYKPGGLASTLVQRSGSIEEMRSQTETIIEGATWRRVAVAHQTIYEAASAGREPWP